MKQILTFLFVLSISLFNASADNGTDAVGAVRVVMDQVKTVVQQNKANPSAADNKIKEILVPVFDFDELSRSCLGANWNKGTPAQQQEFIKLFSELLSRTYLQKIRKNIETSEVTYLDPTLKEDRVTVKTVIDNGGEIFHIDYRLLKTEKWKVYDIMVENVGLVTNYRSEFSSVVRKDGFDGLLNQLRTKVQSL
jgi:phospholipid transport system substrate-binding protein